MPQGIARMRLMRAVFLDTETSGLNPLKHHVLELAFKIVDVGTGEILHSYETIVRQNRLTWEKADPLSLLVNGFHYDLVKEATPVEKVSGAIVTAFARNEIQKGKAVFICQNPSFDRAFFSQIVDPDLQEMLEWPYHWLDLASMYWAKHINKEPLPWKTGVSKDKISEAYGLDPEEKPHRAMNGVDHLLLCYEAVVGFPAKQLVK